MANLPEPVRPGAVHRRPRAHPGLVRAAVSPTAAAAAAVGAGIGVADHSVVVAVVLAVVGWTGRMAAAAAARRRRERAARPRPAELDPWSVPQPWRSLVEQAMAVQSRFDRTVQEWPDGPIRDHLTDLQPRVWAEVEALGSTARRGAAADGWDGARLRPGGTPVEQLSEELRRLQEERRSGPGGAAGVTEAAALDRREEALAAQIRARRQATEASAAAQDRLRAAVARLDAAVTDLLGTGSAAGPSGLAGTGFTAAPVDSALDDLSDEIASLGAAIAETSAAPPDPARS